MHGSPLGLQTWAIAIYLLTTNLKGVSSMKLHRDLGITQKTAWYLAHRIRETWGDEAGCRSHMDWNHQIVGVGLEILKLAYQRRFGRLVLKRALSRGGVSSERSSGGSGGISWQSRKTVKCG